MNFPQYQCLFIISKNDDCQDAWIVVGIVEVAGTNCGAAESAQGRLNRIRRIPERDIRMVAELGSDFVAIAWFISDPLYRSLPRSPHLSSIRNLSETRRLSNIALPAPKSESVGRDRCRKPGLQGPGGGFDRQERTCHSCRHELRGG